MSNTSAGGPKLGYLYQASIGLQLFVEERPQIIQFEALDDIDMTYEESVTLTQSKHTTSGKTLTDKSRSLWKTLYNWITSCDGLEESLDKYRLLLVTNQNVQDDSACDMLRSSPDGRDNDQDIVESLIQASEESENDKLEEYFDCFGNLSGDEKLNLIEKVQVLERTKNVHKLASEIPEELKWAVAEEYHERAFEELQGWWNQRVIESLLLKKPISFTTLKAKIDELRLEYGARELPRNFEGAEPPEDGEYGGKLFVKQLKWVDYGSKTHLNIASQNYYKATSERSGWVNDGRINPAELKRFDDRLKEDWHYFFQGHTSKICENKVEAGQKVYDSCQTPSNPPEIRGVSAPKYIVRGSFEQLAEQGEIGWHPDYEDLIQSNSEEDEKDED